MVAQPLRILRVMVDDQESGGHAVALGHDYWAMDYWVKLKRTRTRAS